MTAMRLLPALALTAGVALAFKISGLASAPWGTIFDAHAAAEAAAPTPAADDAHAEAPAGAPADGQAGAEPAAAPAPAAADPVQMAAAQSPADATSQGEADVLRSLSARREALSARERDLAVREQTLAVAEKRVEERVAELKAIEARINAALGQREAAHQEQIQSLIKMYESMKPGDAAKIFEKMGRDILVSVSSKMKPVKLGAILALMDPGKAQDLTVLLANRLNPDQIMGTTPPAAAEPAIVPPPAPAPQPAASAAPAALQPDVLPQANAAAAPAPAATLPPDTLPSAPVPAPAPSPSAAAAPNSNAAPPAAPPAPPVPGKS
jgi:flagellar motility protein MotE (MotC chaperone)